MVGTIIVSEMLLTINSQNPLPFAVTGKCQLVTDLPRGNWCNGFCH